MLDKKKLMDGLTILYSSPANIKTIRFDYTQHYYRLDGSLGYPENKSFLVELEYTLNSEQTCKLLDLGWLTEDGLSWRLYET